MRPKNSQYRGARGFTLLELLLAMAITAVIIVIVFGAFRVGIRAWEKGEQNVEKQQRIRVVTQLMTHQLSSLFPSGTMKKTTQMAAFEGSESQVSFFSTFALHPDNRQSVVFSQFIVESDVDGANLFLIEKKVSQAGTIVDLEALDDADRVAMLSGLTALRFQYLGHLNPDGGWDWQPQWNLDGDSGWPLAVRVQIVDPAFSVPLTVLIPLRSRGPV